MQWALCFQFGRFGSRVYSICNLTLHSSDEIFALAQCLLSCSYMLSGLWPLWWFLISESRCYVA